MRFFIFLGSVLLFLFGTHYAVFRSIICFFHITRPAVKSLLYTACTLLAVSFVCAFILLHRRHNAWTVWYYRFAATWTGFLIYFFLAILVVWKLMGAAWLAGVPFKSYGVAAVSLAVFALWAFYGMWSAFHPVVRELTIPITNLPEAWEEKTIVQLSDLHLGDMFGTGFAERVFKQVNDLNPDLIVITGDLFDGTGGHSEEFMALINRLRARRGILFVTGNHEYYVGIRKVMNALKKTRLRVLNNEMIDIDGLQIVGVSYPGIHGLSDIANLPRPDNTKHARILLFHTPTNLAVKAGPGKYHHVRTYWMPDTSYTLNKQLKIDLQLSGHTHNGQIFPFNLLTHWLYKGHDYGLTKDGTLRLYTSCGTGSWGPPMRTPIRPEIVRIRLVSPDTAK